PVHQHLTDGRHVGPQSSCAGAPRTRVRDARAERPRLWTMGAQGGPLMARWPWSKARPVLSYRKSGGMPPADNETLEIRSDATFTLWRSNAEAVRPAAPLGRFTGTVPDFEGLQKLARAAGAVPLEDTQFPPDAAVETVGLDTSRHQWAEPSKLPAPWAAL